MKTITDKEFESLKERQRNEHKIIIVRQITGKDYIVYGEDEKGDPTSQLQSLPLSKADAIELGKRIYEGFKKDGCTKVDCFLREFLTESREAEIKKETLMQKKEEHAKKNVRWSR